MPTSPAPTASPKPLDYLDQPITVGEPDISGPLAVFPLFAGEPLRIYTSFAQGREHGVTIKELEGGASVGDLHVVNPTDKDLLLYEGEEVLGAQQNRNFDVSALVGAGTSITVPVSCVEAGRWDGSRYGEGFRSSPDSAPAELRRSKAEQIQASIEQDREARADQSKVWSEIALRSARLDVKSETGAMNDIYESRRKRLAELLEPVQAHSKQCGALAAIAGKFVVLDWVSRPDVFESLRSPLAQGYALDALEVDAAIPVNPPNRDEARAFVKRLLEASGSERDGVGVGRELRISGAEVIGSALVAGTELVQLTAYPSTPRDLPESAPSSFARIRPPSQRRR